MTIAAKVLSGDFRHVLDSEDFKAEAKIMADLNHDNIVRFIGISDDSKILQFSIMQFP